MGVSPKKTSNGAREVSSSANGGIVKLLLTACLCLGAYFLTKPSNASSEAPQSLDLSRTSSRTVSDRSINKLGFWNAPEQGEFYPQIAWLMSYPNSGTSFTMSCIERTSNLSTATNYGDEVTAKGDYSISIYPRHPEGPFWEGLSGKLGAIRKLPENYVLVKTHCGSRCIKCEPSEYIETFDSFLDACRQSTGRVSPDGHKEEYYYPIERVKKAIHLIRNPYHNFVARYHLERKNAIQHGKKQWVNNHPQNATGFQRWCMEWDTEYKKQEFETFEHDLLKQVQLSPCHNEVFKYTQWHNLAFRLTEKLGIETMVVYYEDYESNFDETLDSILTFLELPRATEPRNFEAGHEYSKYYTFLDKRRIRLLIEEIASDTTMKYLERYFDKNNTFYDTDLSEDQDPKKKLAEKKRFMRRHYI